MPEKIFILTGFMGSGKSSVGNFLAKQLGCPFIDLDAEIVKTAGCSINDIFASDGEQVFRQLESFVLEKLLAQGGAAVLATGGGAVISDNNRIIMRNFGVVINLKVTVEQVMSRLQGCNDRPLLEGVNVLEKVTMLMAEREQFYTDADIRIDTDGKSVEDVSTEIVCRLKGFFE